jgi:hypothetical protein
MAKKAWDSGAFSNITVLVDLRDESLNEFHGHAIFSEVQAA